MLVAAAAVTVMVNAGRVTLVAPALIEIEIPEYWPIWAEEGVPVRTPVLESNFAHTGACNTEKDTAEVPAFATFGWKR